MTKEEHNSIKDGDLFWGIEGLIEFDQNYNVDIFVKCQDKYHYYAGYEGVKKYHTVYLISKIEHPSEELIQKIIKESKIKKNKL